MKVDIFPTAIWIKDYAETIDTTSIVELCNTIKDGDSVGRNYSNRNGWQSLNLSSGSFEELNNLEEHIINESKQFLDQIGYENSLSISNMWFNVNRENSFNIQHIHPRSLLSGVFYLNVPEGSGDLVFHRNSMEDYILSNFNTSRLSVNNTCIMKYKPVKHRLILFPAWLAHSVETSTTDEPRISIAFNIKQK